MGGVQSYMTTSMDGDTLPGDMFSIIEAFDFASCTETPWNRCLMLSSSSEPFALAKALASLVSWLMAVGCSTPSVLKGMGMKGRPPCSQSSP